jgi:uncharacterized damage-inducible protein DinB
MRTVCKNTIAIAEDIPEKNFGYRPTAESRSVAETSLEGFNFGELIAQSEPEEKSSRSKAEIIELLRAEGERWCARVEITPEAVLEEEAWMPGGTSKSRFEVLLGTKEHEMHHRGQLMVMERMLGVVPHLTRNRRAAAREKVAS